MSREWATAGLKDQNCKPASPVAGRSESQAGQYLPRVTLCSMHMAIVAERVLCGVQDGLPMSLHLMSDDAELLQIVLMLEGCHRQAA